MNNKSARRDTLTILSDLLQNMREPKRITNLLYASNLSYTQLVKYLKMIQDMELAVKKPKPFVSYSITTVGEFFVETIQKRQEPKILVK